MINRQKNYLDSFDRVKEFNLNHSAETGVIAEYAAEQTRFNQALSKIKALGTLQSRDNSSLGKMSLDVKRKMAMTVVKFAKKGRVKASQAGEMELAGKLGHAFSYIFRGDKQLAVERARVMQKVMQEHLAILTNINAADIAAIDAAIAAYEEARVQPQVARQKKSAEATKQLPTEYLTAIEAIENMYDLLYGEYIDTQPGLVNGFKLMKHVIAAGIRHTTLTVVVKTATGAVATGLHGNIEGLKNKEAVTDKEGRMVFRRFIAGTYNLKLCGDGYQTKIILFHIKRGQHLEVEAEVERI
ncbi:MAG: hypothetical protein IPP77_11710 [Bacteroidetes bacterium]|nr:hypothetical protein [Bacteroidota bacterium]